MTGVLFDNFTFRQPDDTPNVAPNPSWGPPSRRSTFSSGNGSSSVNVSTPGWTVSSGTTLGSNGGISYRYVDAQNFTPLQQIILGGNASPSYERLQLFMTDGTRSQSLAPNDTTSGSAIWNMSSFTNINKSKITFVSITLAPADGTLFSIHIVRFRSTPNTVKSTIGDEFINAQGPINSTVPFRSNSAWTPETSSRQIRTSNAQTTIDINRSVARGWHSVITGGASASIAYLSTTATFNLLPTEFFIDAIISIIINTNVAISSLTLTMIDTSGSRFSVIRPLDPGNNRISIFLNEFRGVDIKRTTEIIFTITNQTIFTVGTFNAFDLKTLPPFAPPPVPVMTTVDDFFNTPQEAAGEPNTLAWSSEPPVGWTPINSDRILGGDSPEFIESNISGGEWNFTIRAGNNAQLIYQPPEGEDYDMHLLLSISVEDLFLDNGNGNLQLTLEDSTGGTETVTKPITDDGIHTYTFPVSDFIGVDLFNVTLIRFTINNLDEEGGDSASGSATAISSMLICVAKDTMILMANGAKKAIQDIQRGEMVVGDGGKIYNRVARVIHNKLPGATPVSLVTIEKDAIAKNKPDTKLIMTASHPILYNGARHPAQRFRKFPGITYYGKKGTVASDVLPVNEDGTYSLYNIQYEHDGYFVANGVTVDSLPVMSTLAPLPKELFFDQKLYNKPSTVTVASLDKDFVKPPKKK